MALSNHPAFKKYWVAMYILCPAFTIWLYVLWYKYQHMSYFDWDLAFFSQACWNLLHGTQYVSLVGINYFGDHSYFGTILTLPFYALFPHAFTLVVLKLVAFLCSAFLLYRIFLKRFSVPVSLSLMTAYLLFPPNVFTICYDFNPESLAVPFIVLMFDAFERRQWKLFWVNALILGLFKENLLLITAAFGIYGWIRGEKVHQKPHAIALFFISMVLFFILVMYVIPHFRQMPTHAFVVRYSYLGDSLGEIAWRMLTQPEVFLKHIFTPLNERYILLLFGPFIVPSLFGLPVLAVSFPLLFQHLLSASFQEHSILYHYGLTIAPFIFLASADGFFILKSRFPRFVFLFCFAVVITSSLMCLFGFRGEVTSKINLHTDDLTKERWELVQQIPKQAPVIATFNFLAPLSTRPELYAFYKIHNESFQNPKAIRRSELNVHAVFILPDGVRYALIDLNDPWLKRDLRLKSQATSKRVNNFLKKNNWKEVKRYGDIVLLQR